MRPNCLTYALDRWHRTGGYLVIRKSEHWIMPHVLHGGEEGISHFVPPHDLEKPSQALFGFEGEAHTDDSVPASPVPLRGIVAGGWVLAITVTLWAVWTLLKSAIAKE